MIRAIKELGHMAALFRREATRYARRTGNSRDDLLNDQVAITYRLAARSCDRRAAKLKRRRALARKR